ncbi:F390 synthetase-related protein [Cytobacillus sp. FJAT-54145]|uniref:F390 synthetase-related protein n=1 Tax=Cytobacillus spartinae TaxID=3299023 RepID=A0ABW6KGT0_9BACI
MSIPTVLKEYITQKYFRRFHTRERLDKFQQKKIQRHLKFVLSHSDFYKKYFSSFSIKNWTTLPTINKEMMMQYFDELNTVGIQKDEAFQIAFRAEKDREFSPTINGITIGLSSGTSGNRGLFIVSPRERFRWAGVVLAKLLPGGLLTNHRIAFFLRANSNLYTTTKSKKIQFSFFDLMDDFGNHVDRLNQYEPTILVAPPSMLRFLAETKLAGKLEIDPIKVISVAEVLEDIDKNIISKAFNQKVHQVYQCTEGFLGASCEHGTLHMNEDIIAVQKEYVDEDEWRFTPIITDFSRTSQPIIRYHLNDILIERKESCPCGSPFLAIDRIEGRTDDVFYLRKMEDEELRPIFPDFFRRAMMESSDYISEYRVIQSSPQLLEIQIKWEKGYNEQKQVEESIHHLCESFSVSKPEIHFVSYAEQVKGVKLRRIERRPFVIE